MKVLLVAMVCAVLGAVVWGMVADTKPAPTRTDAHGVAVDSAWYRNLPADPITATDAFLQRVPASARERGNAFSDTRFILLPLRIGVLCISILLILLGGSIIGMRRLAQRISSRISLQDAIFTGQFLLALFLLNLPVETYAGFVRFREAGFSQISFPEWLKDLLVSWAAETPFYVVGLVTIMALIRKSGRSWIGWATAVYLVLAFVHDLIFPLYVEPLFNRLTPLADGPTKQAILSLARANGVPTNDIFVRDASRQSDLLDAHVSGFAGTAQIILDDNTVAHTSLPEVKMVMAHEIGHYVLAHEVKAIIFFTLVIGVGFLFISWSARTLILRFGPRWEIIGDKDTSALIVLWFLFLLWGYLTLPLTNSITREQEIEADLYGLNASQEPIGDGEFMIRDADTGRLEAKPIEEWIFYSHPCPRNRILTAMRWRAEHMPKQ